MYPRCNGIIRRSKTLKNNGLSLVSALLPYEPCKARWCSVRLSRNDLLRGCETSGAVASSGFQTTFSVRDLTSSVRQETDVFVCSIFLRIPGKNKGDE